MNYFSHYLTLSDLSNPYLTLGCILPDMLRDSKLDNSFFTDKEYDSLAMSKHEWSLSEGIRCHIIVDKYFHNSTFFKENTQAISQAIRQDKEIGIDKYTYFIAHILLELYIDYLLIKQQEDKLGDFYHQLEQINREEVKTYFKKYLPNHDLELFVENLDIFVRKRFLFNYIEKKNLGVFVSSILKKVNIGELSKYDQEKIVTIIDVNYGMKIENDIPSLFSEMKEPL